MDTAWLQEGLDAPPDPREERDYGTRRFYLDGGESKDIIFLSEANQFVKVRQHEVWPENSKGPPKYYTCCEDGARACPLCALADVHEKLFRKEMWIGTILNLTGYKSKKNPGEIKGQNTRELFVLNKRSKEMLTTLFSKLFDTGVSAVRGMRFTMTRTEDQQAFKTGNVPLYMGTVNLQTLIDKQINVTPFNLRELEEFRPSFEICTKIAERYGGTPAKSGTTATETVPF